MKKSTPRIQKLVNALVNGKMVSGDQIFTQFGLANPTAAISYLRNKRGYVIGQTYVKGKTRYSLVTA